MQEITIFENDTTVGITSVVFTGITSTDGTKIESDFDINQNQIPRGGLIVSSRFYSRSWICTTCWSRGYCQEEQFW